MGALNSEQAARLVDVLAPLIGVQGEVEGRMVELVEVLDEGPGGCPCVALVETGPHQAIQTNQYGNPLTRQARIRTLSLLSEVDQDVHPVLRGLLPDPVLKELREVLQEIREACARAALESTPKRSD